jgi:outer membrane biosynthesis protein TonB
MRRAAGLGVLVLVGALAVPIATATPVAAQNPSVTPSPAMGPPGTSISFAYTYGDTCEDIVNQGTYTAPYTAFFEWNGSSIGSQIAADDPINCSATLNWPVPSGTAPGVYPITANLQDSGGAFVTGSEASASFTVTPAPTPTPTRTPTPKPTPRPTPTPSRAPTPTPAPTPKPTPTPTPLPTPPAFIGGGGGGGSGGGSPEGGAACSGGIGRSPTAAELTAAVSRLHSGTDPSTVQIEILSSPEYYQDAGGNDLDFINRLYDDVLRHDPTPVEIDLGLATLSGTGTTGITQLVQAVVLSAEARAIRVDQAFHTLLDTYPSSAELALWVNRLVGSGVSNLSGNALVAEVAASAAYYTLVGSKGPAFVSLLYQALLNRAPTTTELKDDAPLITAINTGNAADRLSVADQVVTSIEYLGDQVTSLYANYLHPTCPALMTQECGSTLGSPTAAELSAALTGLAGSSTEESIIAGVLGSDQYYQNHGSTQAGLIAAVYRDLLGRAPTDSEMSAALAQYPNDLLGHMQFAQAMTGSNEYRDLVVSFDFQQLLLRAPLASETLSGNGVLGGDTPSLQTPDQTLVEQLMSTPEYLADSGGTPSRFVVHTIYTLLMQSPTTAVALQYLSEPLPHDARWQTNVAEAIVDSSQYETAFVRGVYQKYLTYTLCATAVAVGSGGKDSDLLKQIPGGWVGLGLIALVVLLGVGAAVFFTLERRRFARTYSEEIHRRQA